MRMHLRRLAAAITTAGGLVLAAAGAGGSTGCSCDAGGNPTPGFTLVFAFVAATLWARGRRRS
jgi:MYXO-CTERM domain-containing protein